MSVALETTDASSRGLIARIRPPVGMGRFVHYNWFWLDRAIRDPAISFALVRGGPRKGVTGCIAFGPHEQVDLDPRSRLPRVGEIYHVVIDRRFVGRRHGPDAIAAAVSLMRTLDPAMLAVRVSHHAENAIAARLYSRLGFRQIGEKVDGETGIRDKLLELSLRSQGDATS